MKKQEVIESLDELLDVFSMLTKERADDEIRSWLMAATLRIWAGNKLFAEDYIEILSVFEDKQYTPAQVITALDCAGEASREMNVPAFFQEIVEKDVTNDTSFSRTVADTIGRFLVLPALYNGDFTLEEARALGEISDLLIDYCDRKCVKAGKSREYRPEMITPLNTTGYYRPATEEQQKKNSPAPKQTDPVNQLPHRVPPAREEDDQSGIPLTFDLTLDEEDDTAISDPASGVTVKKPEKDSAEETLESVMEELQGLVGLENVKNDIRSLLNFIKICHLRTQRGMKVPTVSYHLVFTGNPGTGKTTVARLVAKLYYLMGILPQGQLVETDRSGLVAGYLGQTAIKTQKVIQEALGGVLFIDEAYSLANDEQDSYGKEAIETILKAMEDHRDELVVIVAGYDELMHQFIDSNPGLRSRFNKYFQFSDYDGNELLLILKRFCNTNGYTLAEEAIPYLQVKLNNMYTKREEHFGNARAVRNLFERAINQQANRLVLDSAITDQELAELTLEDIIPAMEEL